MSEIKESNHGGARPGAGRKPHTDYSIREQFKVAFDSYVTEEKWVEFIKDCWDSNNWFKKKFLIEQRIGRPAQVSEKNNSYPITIDELMAKFENPDTFGKK